MAKKKATKKKTTKKNNAKTSPQCTNLIEIGRVTPVFTLKDQSGVTHKLSQYKGQYIVLYFYPKDNTTGCTKEACAFRDDIEYFKDLNAVVIGVSPDSEVSHTKFIEKYKLPFTLLADPDKKMLEKYGVWQEKSMYGKKYMGVVRTTYIIDPKGKVAARFDKVKVASHIQELRKKLEELQS